MNGFGVGGFSDAALASKIGVTPGKSVFLRRAPQWYRELLREQGLSIASGLPADFAHIFCSHARDLTDFLDKFNLDEIGSNLWCSWPKKSSGIQTDITEQTFRDHILPLGWVDVKVAAIDETWSGLKFVRRRKA